MVLQEMDLQILSHSNEDSAEDPTVFKVSGVISQFDIGQATRFATHLKICPQNEEQLTEIVNGQILEKTANFWP